MGPALGVIEPGCSATFFCGGGGGFLFFLFFFTFFPFFCFPFVPAFFLPPLLRFSPFFGPFGCRVAMLECHALRFLSSFWTLSPSSSFSHLASRPRHHNPHRTALSTSSSLRTRFAIRYSLFVSLPSLPILDCTPTSHSHLPLRISELKTQNSKLETRELGLITVF